MARKKEDLHIDPDFIEMYYKRMLAYKEKHFAWEIFKGVYWAVYIFAVGLLFLFSANTPFNMPTFIGYTLVLLSIFYGIFGLVTALHLKFMRRFE